MIALLLLFVVFAKKAYGRAYRQFYCGLGSKLGLSDCVALGIDLKGLLARTNIQSTTCVFLIVGDVSVLTHRHRGQSFPRFRLGAAPGTHYPGLRRNVEPS